MSNNHSPRSPQRMMFYAFGLITAVSLLLIAITLIAFPENGRSVPLILLVTGAAYLGASGVISGTYNAYTNLLVER